MTFITRIGTTTLGAGASTPVTEPSAITQRSVSTLNNGTSNNPNGYVEYLPENYTSGSNFPLFIWIHGGGEGGDGLAGSGLNTIQNANNQIIDWLDSGNDIPWIVLAPQDSNTNWGAGRIKDFMNWALDYYGSKVNTEQVHISVLSSSGRGFNDFLTDGLDLDKVNTFLVNAGSGGALTAGSQGYTNLINSNIRLWFHHDDGDSVVPVGQRELFWERFQDVYDQPFSQNLHRFTIYDRNAHGAWGLTFNGDGATTAQITRNINGQATNGTTYAWSDPETIFSWMLTEYAASGSFVTVPVTPTEGESVQFNSEIYYADSVSWDFGDGVGTSTDRNPSYTYATDGTYTVTLTLTNRFGGTTDVVEDVIVAPGVLTEDQRAKLDFSLSNARIDNTWNDITGQPHLGTADRTGLTNTSNVNTGWSITYDTASWTEFNSVTANNNNGETTGDDSGVYPDAAMQGYHFAENNGASNFANFTIGGLDTNKFYTLIFFSSRKVTGSNMRTTRFVVGGVQKDLNIFNSGQTAGNTEETVSFESLVPNAQGEIDVAISESGSSRFLYLNVMEIIELS